MGRGRFAYAVPENSSKLGDDVPTLLLGPDYTTNPDKGCAQMFPKNY